MTMTYDCHGPNAALSNSREPCHQTHNSNHPNVILKEYQDCPLCFHSNVFNEWSGYRDAFVSLTTRNFSCPICLSNVQGVDKFTLHLVSHDLRDKMLGSTPFSTNINYTPVSEPDVNKAVPTILPSSSQTNYQHRGMNINFTSPIVPAINKLNSIDYKLNGNTTQNDITRSTLFKIDNYNSDRASNQNIQQLIKDEMIMEDIADVDAKHSTPDIPNEASGTAESLDELLDDYSEYVQQQEHNKINSLDFGSKHDSTMNSTIGSILDVNYDSNKYPPSTNSENSHRTLQINKNQISTFMSGNIVNKTASFNNNLVSLKDDTSKTKNTNVMPPTRPAYAQDAVQSTVASSSDINSILRQPTDLCSRIEPKEKREKQFTINVQVPKPLYHKYFPDNSKIFQDTINAEAPTAEEKSKSIIENNTTNKNCYPFQQLKTLHNQITFEENSHTFQTHNAPNYADSHFEGKADNVINSVVSRHHVKSSQHAEFTSDPSKMNERQVVSNGLSGNPSSDISDVLSSIAAYKEEKTERDDNTSCSSAQSSVQCSICGWNFDNESFLQLHTVLMHSPHRKRGDNTGMIRGGKPRGAGKRNALKSFQCRECNGKSFELHEEFTQHLKLVHNDHRYVCNICAKMFKLRGSLLVHVRVVHNPFDENETEYNCRTCNRKFSSRHRRDLHEKKHDESNVKTLIDGTRASDLEKNLKTISSFSNQISTAALFSPHTNINSTTTNELSVVPPDCNLSLKSEQMGIWQQDIQPFQQKKLEIQNETQDMNRIRFNSSIETKDSVCSNPSLKDPNSPQKKVLNLPDSPANDCTFQCTQCDKKFKKQTHLNQHSLTHEGTRQWECDVCKKTFTTKYFLKKHKRLHTGETPYSCNICGKSFTFQQSYHKHMLYHTDEKPYSCSQCGRSFKELSTLQNHERIHSGERPFACETCGKSFRQRVSYLVHRRIHTGVMPYTCNLCGKNFRYKVTQRTHKCIAKSQTDSPNVLPEEGSEQDEEKKSIPSLPKQIQEDLQKFRKAQNRRMLHNRLHTYINQLHDATKPSDSTSDKRSLEEQTHLSLTQNYKAQTTDSFMFQSNTNSSPSCSSFSQSLSPQIPQEQSPGVGLINSGKASPIGQKLQQLTINEGDKMLNHTISQQQYLTNQNFLEDSVTNHLFVDGTKSIRTAVSSLSSQGTEELNKSAAVNSPKSTSSNIIGAINDMGCYDIF